LAKGRIAIAHAAAAYVHPKSAPSNGGSGPHRTRSSFGPMRAYSSRWFPPFLHSSRLCSTHTDR